MSSMGQNNQAGSPSCHAAATAVEKSDNDGASRGSLSAQRTATGTIEAAKENAAIVVVDEEHLGHAPMQQGDGGNGDRGNGDRGNGDGSAGDGSGSSSGCGTWPIVTWLRVHRHLLVLAVSSTLTTAWWVAGLVLHRHDKGWIVPFLVWFAVTVRLWTLHAPLRCRLGAGVRAVRRGKTAVYRAVVPDMLAAHRHQRYRHVPLAAVTVAVLLIGTFVPTATADNPRKNRAVSLFGLLVFLGLFYATSRHRRHVDPRAVLGGVLLQFLLGVFVLKTKPGFVIFEFLGNRAKTLLGYSADGTAFLTSRSILTAGWFLVSVVPAVIFFVALVHLLHYWGWIPWLVGYFASAFTRLLGLSGAEAVVAAASPFIGQGESAVLIREYMPKLTRAEIHQIMTSGFASIAGSVMSAYMQMGISPLALVSSCVMSIPASIALSKLRCPETEEPITRGGTRGRDLEQGRDAGAAADADADPDDRTYNSLHAVSKGSWLGLKIAGMIVANVLCIMALLGLADGLLGWAGGYIQVPQLRLQLIVGYLLYPVAFLLGVERRGDELRRVAELIGIKIVANEFVAYGDLTTDPRYAALSPRSRLIAIYALCGFGNLAAVGIQIGALSQLAPYRSGDVAREALSALITGIVATLTSASIAGMLSSGAGIVPAS